MNIPPHARNIPTPDMYQRVFEQSKEGAEILDYLWHLFAHGAVTKGGIDAILKTYESAGARNVLEFIIKKINQANGAPHDEPHEGD